MEGGSVYPCIVVSTKVFQQITKIKKYSIPCKIHILKRHFCSILEKNFLYYFPISSAFKSWEGGRENKMEHDIYLNTVEINLVKELNRLIRKSLYRMVEVCF